MNTIYVYCPYKGSHGIDVIINELIPALNRNGLECILIDSLDGIPTTSTVFPYTMDPALECLKKGYKTELCFSMDALTLGYWNKIWFYLKHLNVFHYDFVYSVAAFFCFIISEITICKKYNKLVLVSPTDIDYLVKVTKQPQSKFICVSNGVIFPEFLIPKTHSDKLRLGLLASWGAKQTYQESAWFVKEYFVRYAKQNPNVVLKLIGRGPFIEKLRGLPGVEIVGEVDSLNQAFSDVDVFIGANPKGCGVLNRVLDAMAYKTPILALPECFTGIPKSENLYYKFSSYKSFVEQINYIQTHREEAVKKAIECYDYVREQNNWAKNYNKFAKKIIEYLDNKE